MTSDPPAGSPVVISSEWLASVPDLAHLLPPPSTGGGQVVMRGEDWGVSVRRFRLRLLDRDRTILAYVRDAASAVGAHVEVKEGTGALRFEHGGWTFEAQAWGVYLHIFVTTRTPPAPAEGARALARTLRELRPFIDFADEQGCEITQAARFDFASGHTFGHLCFEQVGLEEIAVSILPGYLARRGFLRGADNTWTLGERGRVRIVPLGQDELRVEIPGLAEFERFAEEALRGA